MFAKRDTLHVPEGSSLSLSCDIQHCGDTWTGKWTWSYSDKTDKKFIENSDRHSLTNVTLSANKTRLLLKFLSVNQSDEGFYGCMVTWGDQSLTGQGHFTYVNITAGMLFIYSMLTKCLSVCNCMWLQNVCIWILTNQSNVFVCILLFLHPPLAVATKRNLLHRFLVCACAGLCALAILGLAHCLRSGVRPHLLPRTQFTYPHEYSDQPHSPPKPPPRRPVPKKRSNPSHKGISYLYW